MEYKVKKDKIEIIGKDDFNPKHILECGQIFRFNLLENNNYEVFSLDKKAEIQETEVGYDILTRDPIYFEEFFNLKTDYKTLKEKIKRLVPEIKDEVDKAKGLRILKGDFFEVLVSFIISQNNNIKRIKLIINRLCAKVGEEMDGYFSFPKKEAFFKLTEEDFKEMGAGYRAKFLSGLKEVEPLLNKEVLCAMPDVTLRETLLKIKGVGRKVADCIMLFAFNRYSVFPVDVWIERVYFEYFGKEKISRKEISTLLSSKFKDNAGLIQQYLFYSKTVKN